MPTKSYKGEMRYRSARKTAAKSHGCNFCKFDKDKKSEVVKNYDYFWVVKNIFAYDIWDDQGVVDHLMLVPKRHIDSLDSFNNNERLEYSKILGIYDKLNYSAYARSLKNTVKSVAHQHTHLIKLDGKEISFMFFSQKPYVLLKKG